MERVTIEGVEEIRGLQTQGELIGWQWGDGG